MPFDWRALSLSIHAAMHPGLNGGRRTRPRRRPANLSLVALSSSYSARRSNCHHGAKVVQDRCPAFSIAGGGEVRLLAGPGACAEPLCGAAACSGAPNHLLPVRVGQTAYVRRGGADGAAGALNGGCRRWIASWPSYQSRGTLGWPGEHARSRQYSFCSERSALSRLDPGKRSNVSGEV